MNKLESRVPKAPDTKTNAENTSLAFEIAFLPVLHIVFFNEGVTGTISRV